MASERSARPETKSINRWTSSRYWRKISSSISLRRRSAHRAERRRRDLLRSPFPPGWQRNRR
jgi:hypothetical protein